METTLAKNGNYLEDIYRVFFNINKGDDKPWCIDRGRDTERMWVYQWRALGVDYIGGGIDSSTHPRAWNELRAVLRIKDGVAIFSPR